MRRYLFFGFGAFLLLFLLRFLFLHQQPRALRKTFSSLRDDREELSRIISSSSEFMKNSVAVSSTISRVFSVKQTLPLPSLLSATSFPVASSLPISSSLLAPQTYIVRPIPVDLRTVVGVQCNFKNGRGDKGLVRGSGVIVSSDGHILTNRHVVDSKWAAGAYEGQGLGEDYILQGCEIRIFPSEQSISSEDRYPYPFFDLNAVSGFQFDFNARLEHLPEEKGLSETELKRLDYAILKITDKNPSKYFSKDIVPIHHAPLLLMSSEQVLQIGKGNRVVIPVYAYQATGDGAFSDYRLLTKDAILSEIYAGDGAFQDIPFILETDVLPDAYSGRSGSPIFYNGYVIGVFQSRIIPKPNVSEYKGNQTSISAIYENLSGKLEDDTSFVFEDVYRPEVQH